MLGSVGSFSTGLALITTLYAALASLLSIQRDDARWWSSGRNAIFAAASLLGLGVLLLLSAFLGDQFAIEYVAQHSSRDLPLYLKASAVWGGQDGSLLLWAFLQALFAAMIVGTESKESQSLVRWATVFLSLITAFFVAMTLFLSNPFAHSLTVPSDGQGLNPLLRHPGMVFHPPTLYLGYVGLAVPFALALAALITRRIEEWPEVARSWTLAAWLFLGLGLFLGMRWAYDVLGWGGYWGWDPVENAGLMPWLTATGLLHGLVMQDQRRGFRWWNMIFTLLSFVLVLFGTFTTRSGLIQSVHAFARSPMGPYFLAAIAVTLVGSLALFYSRRSMLSASSSSHDLLSREGMFTLTLILLVTITMSVLVGSVLPTLTEALTDQRFEAGPSWFDRVTGPQLAALVLVMGVCPLLGRAVRALRKLRREGLLTLLGGVVVPLAGAMSGFTRPLSLVGFAVVGLAGGTALGEILRGLLRRRRQGENTLEAFWHLFGRNRRRYGGYLVHLGVILMAVGVIGTRFYPLETEAVLASGESVDYEGYRLVFEDLERDVNSDRVTVQALISVHRNGRHVTTLRPGLDEYASYRQTVATPAVRVGPREDLYLVLGGWSDGGSQVTLKILINPLASFLWLGGLVFLAGGSLALWAAPQAKQLTASEARLRRAWNSAGLTLGILLLALAVWMMWGRGTRTTASAERLEGNDNPAIAAQPGGRPRAGGLAPAFTVDLLDGSTLSLSELRGRVTVINFWSPDCQPCEDELPSFQRVWEEYQGEGVVFLGISFPGMEPAVEELIAELGVTYPNTLDARVPVSYGITGVPETFVVGPEGKVAYVHIGPLRADRLRKELDSLLMN